MRRSFSFSPVVLIVALSNLFGCGGGCSCMAPIPGGFAPAERAPNAGQIRVSQSGLASITADPAGLLSALTGGPLQFDLPDSCGGTPALCCPGGNPVSPCGPINVDLTAQDGDDPRLVVTPVQDASRIDVIVRARVTTITPIPVGLFGLDCELVFDTTQTNGSDPFPDLQIDAPVSFVQDATAGTTRIEVGDIVVGRFTDNDFEITEPGGGFGACSLVSAGAGLFVGIIAQTFADQIKGAIADQACKACPSGDVAECGSSFATACTDGVCMEGDVCFQEIGVDGRLAGAALFGGFSPGTSGAMDVYEVAGGYAKTDNGGIGLGLLGGMLPAGTEHARCGPLATPPPDVTIPESAYFQGNTRPDTGAEFDLAIGLHESQLDAFAYAGYDGGIRCLTIDSDTVALVNSGSFSLLIPSLGNLAPASVPMALGLRPQSPPVIVLGTNTFLDDGAGNVTVDDPLLDITFTAMEIDFFAAIEGQYIRLFTLVADVRLPVGLQVGTDGTLTPVLGDLADAFTNLSAKNSDPLLETPTELAELFPTILGLALGQLGTLGAIDVPTVGGLQLDITDITAVDNLQFLAIFGSLGAANKPTPRVDTEVTIASLDLEGQPRLQLSLGGSEGGLEWSVRVDGGWWSAWSPSAQRTIEPDTFRLQGHHQVEVRARRHGQSYSTDRTPAILDVLVDSVPPSLAVENVEGGVHISAHDNVSTTGLVTQWRFGGGAWTTAPASFTVPLLGRAPTDLEVEAIDEAGLATGAHGPAGRIEFHGQASESGCGCQSSGGDPAGWVLIVGISLLAFRRRRLRPRLVLSVLFVLAAASLPACTCGGSPPCGDVECLPGDVARGAVGRWNAVDSDGERTVVSTYDMKLGDLVLVDVGAGEPVYTAVDGIPDETPTHDPSTYRGGIETAGPNVGAWTSVALVDSRARVAYQDRDAFDLKFTIEQDSGFMSYVVDGSETENVGVQTSLAIDGDGGPAIAYLALGVVEAGGLRKTEVRVARTTQTEPAAGSEFAITTVGEGISSCAGLCGDETCVAPVTAGDPQTCVTATSDCATPCAADTETCVAGVCRANVEDPLGYDTPGGAAFPNALYLSDGRLAIVYYDRARTALIVTIESSAGSSSFTETILDGADGADRGMWASAVTDGSTIYIAYQDALLDQLYFTTWAGGAGTPELVDDGLRANDRPHNVGAGATIYLDGGVPTIAYQDGLASDLELASRNGSWSHAPIATGALLDGFHLAATSTGPWLVWDSLDKTRTPVGDLVVREP
jgi:MYXO-CTERM domain-containing protein